MINYQKLKGAMLVELALVMPLLIILAIGIVEFSLAFYKMNVLNKAVQIGARYFSDPLISREDGKLAEKIVSTNIPTTQAVVVNATKTSIHSSFSSPSSSLKLLDSEANFNTSDVTVTIPSTGAPEDHIIVTASYNQNFEIGNLIYNLTGQSVSIPLTYNLQASSVMRVQ